MRALASRRAVVVISLVGTVAVAAFFGGRALWQNAKSALPYPHCTMGAYEVDTSQASVAATMVGAVTRYSPALPERAAVLVLAAGLQESKLRNLSPGEGDRDSVGVLQQRPSQGWGGGDPAKLNDVFEATTEFLNHLVKVAHWQQLPLAVAVQKVQISADGSAYAPHEGEAQALADALVGQSPAAISCQFDKPTTVASTTTVARQLSKDLPVNQPTTTATEIQVAGAHWQTTAWFVANADRLGIDSVAYDHQMWSRAHGWRTDSAAGTTEVVATMAQLKG